MRSPQVPQMMMPCSSAGPSRGGPAARSRPCAAALAASCARLASYWSRVMYPGWARGNEGDPFLAGQQGAGQLPAGKLGVAVPPEGERAGVAGVVQDTQHDVVGQRLPVDLALAGPCPVPPGERQARGVERLHARGGRPGGGEGGEQVREGAPDGGVGVEDDVRRRRRRPARRAAAVISSPRRALEMIPPRSRARMKCSSASYADFAVMPTTSCEDAAGLAGGVGRSA